MKIKQNWSSKLTIFNYVAALTTKPGGKPHVISLTADPTLIEDDNVVF